MIAALAPALLLAATVVPGAVQSRSGALVIRDAWVRASTATRTSSSGYLVIENRGARPVALVHVTARGVGSTELHAVVEDQGRTGMRPLRRAPVPARGVLTLEPGGTHLMLTDIARPLKAGTTLELTLTFDNRDVHTVRALVRPLAAMTVR